MPIVHRIVPIMAGGQARRGSSPPSGVSHHLRVLGRQGYEHCHEPRRALSGHVPTYGVFSCPPYRLTVEATPSNPKSHTELSHDIHVHVDGCILRWYDHADTVTNREQTASPSHPSYTQRGGAVAAATLRTSHSDLA